MRAALLVLALAAGPALGGAPDALELTRLSYRAGVLKLTAALTLGGEKRKEPVWVSVTLRKPRDRVGFELPLKQIAPADLAKPIVLEQKVGPGFVTYAIAVWGQRTPCGDAERVGEHRERCARWGAVLDQPLARLPDGDPAAADAPLAIFEPLDLRVIDGGAGEEETRIATAALRRVAALATSDRGAVIEAPPAQRPAAVTEVLYRDGPQAERARLLRRLLARTFPDKRIEVRQWPQATDAFVVTLAK